MNKTYKPFKFVVGLNTIIIIILHNVFEFNFYDFTNVYFLIFLLLFNLIVFRNYMIRIDSTYLILYRLFGKNIKIKWNEIEKIEFETIKWDYRYSVNRMYIFIKDNIIDYGITTINRRQLYKSIINICASKQINIIDKTEKPFLEKLKGNKLFKKTND